MFAAAVHETVSFVFGAMANGTAVVAFVVSAPAAATIPGA
jgi:hypothetical protein